MTYTQHYDPFNLQFVSTLVAALPVLVMFYLLVFRRAHVPLAAAGGAVAALVVATLVYRMPGHLAGVAFVYGAAFGFLPICWTIIAAMFLYNITVETGKFEDIKNSVAGLSPDHRLQAVLIAFCFGAFLEGAAGGGTPVAICAAMMVGLGFDPFLAAALCLIANTSPVAYGGFGTPIITLGTVSKLDPEALSHMVGNQLPLLSCIVPLWLVRSMCSWKETREVLPAIGVAGGSFAVVQYVLSHSRSFPLTDIAGGLISLVVTALFLNYWRPPTVWRFEQHPFMRAPKPRVPARGTDADVASPVVPDCAPVSAASEPFVPTRKMSLAGAGSAWMPYIVLCVLMVGIGTHTKEIDAWQAGAVRARYDVPVPYLHRQVQRTFPVVLEGTPPEDAIYKLNWVTTPGTSVFLVALLMLLVLRVNGEQLRRIVTRTYRQMAIPVPTVVCMIGLAYVTRYGGLDATLGLAFKNSGALYPFFGTLLGWLGVFLTGTDAGSNALFGSLQFITATQLNLSPVLMCAANSSGGVMGKMIDAQSICVGTAATERVGTEADIFKFVLWHSVTLAAIVGVIVILQAYVPPFTQMVPHTVMAK